MIAVFTPDAVAESANVWTENQQITYDYATERVLPTLREHGLWAAPDPAPLTIEEIVAVFSRIREHDNYEAQTLRMPDHNGVVVTMSPELFSIEEKP